MRFGRLGRKVSGEFVIFSSPSKLIQHPSHITHSPRPSPAVYVICNICTNSVPSFIHFCVEFDSILALTTNLKSSDKPLTLTILSALSNILSIGKDKNYAIMVDEADGVEALEKLQEHEDEEVYMKALRILEKYFNVEEVGFVFLSLSV